MWYKEGGEQLKKNRIAYIILAIVFIVINVIAFVVSTAKTSTFWIAYLFTAIAFVVQVCVWQFSFKCDDNLKSKFLKIPIIFVAVIYLVIQIITFAVFMIFPMIPYWITIIVSVFILGFSVICIISTDVTQREIERLGDRIEKKVFYIKTLQVDVEMLIQTETDQNIKEELSKLAQKIRFSDPMSSDELIDLEMQITEKIKELKVAENKAEIITVINSLITERNKKVKLLK